MLRLARFSIRRPIAALRRKSTPARGRFGAAAGYALEQVEIAALPIDRFSEVLDPGQYADLVQLAAHSRELLEGRVVWCVNSTARGGGVAEMLRSLLAYTRGAGVDTRWVVIKGRPLFFDVTKRLHNRLHGSRGDGGRLQDAERMEYKAVIGAAAAEGSSGRGRSSVPPTCARTAAPARRPPSGASAGCAPGRRGPRRGPVRAGLT